MGRGRSAEARFDELWEPDDVGDCMWWTGSVGAKGYGRFKPVLRNVSAHRFAYERWVGPIPEGLVLDHLCRNRACVNPDHLEPVTCRENILRGEGLAAQNAKRQTCKEGHPLVRVGRWRKCRQCGAAASRRLYARKRGVTK